MLNLSVSLLYLVIFVVNKLQYIRHIKVAVLEKQNRYWCVFFFREGKFETKTICCKCSLSVQHDYVLGLKCQIY